MGQIWDRFQPALDVADAAWDALRVLVLYVAPVGWGTFEVVAYLARTDHLAVAWLTIGVVFLGGVAIARTATQPGRSRWAARCWDRLSSALDQARWFVRDMTIVLTVMWVTCLALLWALTSTNLLAVASRHMPVAQGGIDREALTAGPAAQILSTLTVALPALLVLLVAAGALHRPAMRTESGQLPDTP